ncbi:MAG TPA: DUF6421 family protein, partial [Micrococcaceae bacterium]
MTSTFTAPRTAAEVAQTAEWLELKSAAAALSQLQAKDGSVPEPADHGAALAQIGSITASIAALAPSFPHDAHYLDLLRTDFTRWGENGLGVPDFLDSLLAFQPQQHRINGLGHLVVFPMYTQNGSTNRFVEAVLIEVVWPEFVAELEAGDYSNRLFVPIRFVDFTAGYDTNSAVLFPESV